ncbi:hypothetical protein [Vibrio lentus]|uniref:hypothetical protein n=1 Tax=Vibrio lentus TaxID=136468 RepID=UPI0010561EDF|nr:hypothetical protein [Vibrio lentus]
MIQEMRIAVGHAEPQKKPVDPFSQPTNVQAIQPQQPSVDWTPDKTLHQKIREEEEAKQAENDFINDPMFQGIYGEAEEFLDRLSDEVHNPETPFGRQDAKKEILNFVLEKTAQGGKQNV